MLHSLSHRGISREAYLQIAGRDEQEILTEMEPDAELALRREAVLTAVVAAEAISPSEEELLEALSPTAEREGVEPREAARGPARRRAPGGGARGSRGAQGRRADRGPGDADPRRAGTGARAAVDAGEGRRRSGPGRGARQAVDSDRFRIGQLAF